MDYQKYVQMLKAMADSNRLKIIDLLSCGSLWLWPPTAETSCGPAAFPPKANERVGPLLRECSVWPQ